MTQEAYPRVYNCLLGCLCIQKVINLDFFVLIFLVIFKEPDTQAFMNNQLVLTVQTAGSLGQQTPTTEWLHALIKSIAHINTAPLDLGQTMRLQLRDVVIVLVLWIISMNTNDLVILLTLINHLHQSCQQQRY